MRQPRFKSFNWFKFLPRGFLVIGLLVVCVSIFNPHNWGILELILKSIQTSSFQLNHSKTKLHGCIHHDGLDYCHQLSPPDPNFFFNPHQAFDARLVSKNQFRSRAVKEAFSHAWGCYKRLAWGHDTVEPLTLGYSDTWQGWGVTLVDALDTLILMGLDTEYELALQVVTKINFTHAVEPVLVFESIIRYLGGLLGAYELRPNPKLLDQAVTLAKVLLPAFDTPLGFPAHKLDVLTGALHGLNGRYDRKISLAEIGTLQLEFHRLSQLTNDPTYATLAQKIIDRLDKLNLKPSGLYPNVLDLDDERVLSGKVSFGAMGDSFYEYLLKRYLLTNQTEPQYFRMYVEAMDGLHKHLVEQREMKYGGMFLLAKLETSGQPEYRMDHLACFVPGMLGLGALTLNRTKDFLLAQELVFSCRQLYQMTATGLGPEAVGWVPTPNERMNRQTRVGIVLRSPTHTVPPPYRMGFHLHDARYLLRPETVESIFYMFRLTGDPLYQDWAWEIFQAIDSRCRVEGGFAEYHDVRELATLSSQRPLRNSMESFFLAETLKYLYLTFMPPNHLNLQEYVLTTEAHPLRITT